MLSFARDVKIVRSKTKVDNVFSMAFCCRCMDFPFLVTMIRRFFLGKISTSLVAFLK